MPQGYSSQRDYIDWVKADADKRQKSVETALREALSHFIDRREAEVVVFSKMSALDLARAILARPIILKPLLACCNIAAHAPTLGACLSISVSASSRCAFSSLKSLSWVK